MNRLYACGACCFVLSIWGVLQLTVMGILFKVESTTLLLDVAPDEEFGSIDEYLRAVKNNYAATARNCWIAAGVYLVFIILSMICMYQARRAAKRKAELDEDDEIFCAPPEEKMKMIKMKKDRTKKV